MPVSGDYIKDDPVPNRCDSRTPTPPSTFKSPDNKSASERRTTLPSLGVSIPDLRYPSDSDVPHSTTSLTQSTPDVTGAVTPPTVLPSLNTTSSFSSHPHHRDPFWSNPYSSRSATFRESTSISHRPSESPMDVMHRSQRSAIDDSHVYQFPEPSHHYQRPSSGYSYPAPTPLHNRQMLPSPLALELPHATSATHNYYPTIPAPPTDHWVPVATANNGTSTPQTYQSPSQSTSRPISSSNGSPSVDKLSPLTLKKKRKRADAHQLSVLNGVYARTAFPSTEERKQLAEQLDMTPRSVQIWFQNKRQANRQNRPANSPSHSGSTVSTGSPVGPPTTPPISLSSAIPTQAVDSYGRPINASRPPPPLQTNSFQGSAFSNTMPQGYQGSYRGTAGTVGVSEYGSQPHHAPSYGSSSGPQFYNPPTSFIGNGDSGYATPSGSSHRSHRPRPPSTEI